MLVCWAGLYLSPSDWPQSHSHGFLAPHRRTAKSMKALKKMQWSNISLHSTTTHSVILVDVELNPVTLGTRQENPLIGITRPSYTSHSPLHQPPSFGRWEEPGEPVGSLWNSARSQDQIPALKRQLYPPPWDIIERTINFGIASIFPAHNHFPTSQMCFTNENLIDMMKPNDVIMLKYFLCMLGNVRYSVGNWIRHV